MPATTKNGARAEAKDIALLRHNENSRHSQSIYSNGD